MSFEDTDGPYFLLLARLTNLIPIRTRYVSYGILHRAFASEQPSGVVLIMQLTPVSSAFGIMFSSLSQYWDHEIIGGEKCSEGCATGAGINPDGWAHASCDSCHRGCLGLGYTKGQKKTAEVKLAKAIEERKAYTEKLLDESRWEALPSDSESEKEEEEEWSFDKAGKKKYGPKTEYTVGGCVQAV